jgi:hypothetical protein
VFSGQIASKRIVGSEVIQRLFLLPVNFRVAVIRQVGAMDSQKLTSSAVISTVSPCSKACDSSVT